MLEWLKEHWLSTAQSVAIISGLIVAWHNLLKERNSKKVANYISLIKNHREIWSTVISKPQLNRIRSLDLDLRHKAPTPEEIQFLTFIFLHITCSYEMHKYGQIVYIEQLKFDVKEFLNCPLVRKFWEENKIYYNNDFSDFVDSCASPLPPWIGTGKDQRMKVLVATCFPEKISKTLARYSDIIVFTDDSKDDITAMAVSAENYDIIVAFGYGKILSDDVVKSVECINIHGSLLPYGRGPNPNLSSWINNEPHGVSIIKMDKDADTGPILYQEKIILDTDEETLNSSFEKIVSAAASLFDKHWEEIRKGTYEPKNQSSSGSTHTFKQINMIKDIIENNADEPIKKLLSEIEERHPGFKLVD